MFVWASDKGLYGTGKLTSDGDENVKNPEADLTAEVTVTLNHKDADKIELDIDINPPAPGRIPAEASEEDIAANKLRLAQEDSIRLAYVATFTTEANAKYVAFTWYGNDSATVTPSDVQNFRLEQW